MEKKTPKEIECQLAARLKMLRLQRKWTRSELAKLSHVNVYSLKRFERTGHISLTRLLALCNTLDVLSEFEPLLKPRERVDIRAWSMLSQKIRKRGKRRDESLASAQDLALETKL